MKPNDAVAAKQWAEAWIAAWNAGDLQAVLARFADTVEFSSPKAAAITGNGTVRGKAALADYWRAALAKIDSLRFTLVAAFWDPVAATLVIRYTAELGGNRVVAAEVLELDSDGRARRGTALYGAPAD
jgi:hypothetical protein